MYKFINFSQLLEAMAVGANEYLKTKETFFWQSATGKNRAMSISQGCELLRSHKGHNLNNGILYLFLTLTHSSSQSLLECVAKKIITGLLTETHTRDNIRTTNTLHSQVFAKALLNLSTANPNCYKVKGAVLHGVPTLLYCKSAAIKYIAQQIIHANFSHCERQLKTALKNTNLMLIKNQPALTKKSLFFISTLKTDHKAESIELTMKCTTGRKQAHF